MSGYQRWDGELPNRIPGALGRKEDRAKDKAGFLCVGWTTEVGERLNPHVQQISPGGASDKHKHTHTHTHTNRRRHWRTRLVSCDGGQSWRDLMVVMVIVGVYCMITTCQELSTLSTLCWRPSALAHVLRKSSDTGTIFIPVLWRRQCWPRRVRSLSKEMQI